MNPRTTFFRRLAMLGVLAVGFSACEETRLVLPEPTPIISATPQSIELFPGQTQAIVVSYQNVATGATFESTNTAVATVNATGVVTAVAPGNATIRVRSTANTSLETGVGVRVLERTGVPPGDTAQVTIQSITVSNTLTPVDPQNVAGLVDVTLNVRRGNATQLRVFAGNIEVEACRQNFGTTGTAADGQINAPALQLTQVQGEVVCTINTAAFNQQTGAATFLNGTFPIRAELLRGTTVLDRATSNPLRFNNVNVVVARFASQVNAVGDDRLRWDGGNITVTALPVIYTGATAPVNAVTFRYQVPLGHAEFGGVIVERTDSSSAGGWTATFQRDSVSGTNNGTPTGSTRGIRRVTDPNFQDNLEIFTVIGNQEGPGSPTNTVVTELGTNVTDYRVDNEQPTTGVFTLPSLQADGWLSGAYPFSRGFGVNPLLGGAGTSPTDARSGIQGVGGVSITFHAQLASTLTNPATFTGTAGQITAQRVAQREAIVAANPAITSATSLQETLASGSYRVVARVVDRLGNATTVDLTTLGAADPNAISAIQMVSVDRTPPTVQLIVDPGNMLLLDASDPLPTYQIAYSDSISGFGVNPIRRIDRVVTPEGTICPTGFGNASCTTPTSTSQAAFTLPNVQGYHTLEVYVVDKAGNQSNTIARLALLDIEAPVVSNVGIPPVLAGGQVAQFTATTTDNLNLGTAHFFQGFSGVYVQLEPTRVLGSYGPAFATETSATLTTTSPFIRGLQSVSGAGNPTGTFTNADVARWLVFDLVGNAAQASNPFVFTRPAGSKTTFTTTWSVQPTWTNATVCSPTGSQPACSSTPTSTQIGLTVSGPGTFDRPFERIAVVREVSPNNWISIGQSSAASVTDVGGTRTWTYPGVNWSPGANFGFPASTFRVVGIDAQGDALLSNPVTISVTAGGP